MNEFRNAGRNGKGFLVGAFAAGFVGAVTTVVAVVRKKRKGKTKPDVDNVSYEIKESNVKTDDE